MTSRMGRAFLHRVVRSTRVALDVIASFLPKNRELADIPAAKGQEVTGTDENVPAQAVRSDGRGEDLAEFTTRAHGLLTRLAGMDPSHPSFVPALIAVTDEAHARLVDFRRLGKLHGVELWSLKAERARAVRSRDVVQQETPYGGATVIRYSRSE